MGRSLILLTVSGSIPADLEAEVAAGRRPRPDYVELARGLGADLIDREAARRTTGLIGRLLEAVVGADGLLAVVCFLRCGAYRLVISDGEQIGLPLALCAFRRSRPPVPIDRDHPFRTIATTRSGRSRPVWRGGSGAVGR